jgi:hypothetical protein
VFRDQGPLIGRCCSYLVVNDPRLPSCVSTGFFSSGLFSPRKSQPFDPTLKNHSCQPLHLYPCLAFFQVFRRRLVIASSSFFVKQPRMQTPKAHSLPDGSLNGDPDYGKWLENKKDCPITEKTDESPAIWTWRRL